MEEHYFELFVGQQDQGSKRRATGGGCWVLGVFIKTNDIPAWVHCLCPLVAIYKAKLPRILKLPKSATVPFQFIINHPVGNPQHNVTLHSVTANNQVNLSSCEKEKK